MASSTVTSKGQITVPVEVRHKLGLRAGSRVAFVPTVNGGYEIHAQRASIQDLKGVVPPPSAPVNLADMDRAIVRGATRAVHTVTFDHGRHGRATCDFWWQSSETVANR